jgi:hypothetical protein
VAELIVALGVYRHGAEALDSGAAVARDRCLDLENETVDLGHSLDLRKSETILNHFTQHMVVATEQVDEDNLAAIPAHERAETRYGQLLGAFVDVVAYNSAYHYSFSLYFTGFKITTFRANIKILYIFAPLRAELHNPREPHWNIFCKVAETDHEKQVHRPYRTDL